MKNFSLYLLVFAISCSATMLSFVFMPQQKMGGEKLFKKFVNSFDEAELPYDITFDKSAMDETKEQVDNEDAESPHQIENDKLITSQFSAFVPDVQRSLYSRTPPNRHYFESKLFENDEMIVVTYSVSSFFTPNMVDEYVVATYKKGKDLLASDRLIALRPIASRNPYGATNCSIDTNLRITTAFRSDFEEEEEEEENIEKEVFQIEKDGSIKVIVSLNPFDDEPKLEEQKQEKPLIKAF